MNFSKLFTPILICISILGIFARFWQLASIPAFLYLDEMDHVFVGEALARFGTDITGTWSPLQLRPAPAINAVAELPAVFHAVAQKMFGFGLSSAHIPSAVAGLVAAIVLSASSALLFRSKKIILATFAFASATPLLIHVSRMAYEATISTTFQLLLIFSAVITAKEGKKSSWLALLGTAGMFISMILSYYTYHGAKALLPAITVVIAIFLSVKFRANHSRKRWYVIPVLLIVLQSLLLAQTLALNNNSISTRMDSELIFSPTQLRKEVTQNRETSLDYLATKVFQNIPFTLAKKFTKGYLVAYDLDRLFVTGHETGFQFSLIVYSFFYISFIPFLIFGLRYMWENKRELNTQFFFALLLVAPFATALTGGGQSIFRSQLLYYLLIATCGLGYHYLKKRSSLGEKWAELLVAVCLIAITFETIFFMTQYFGQFVVVSARNQNFHEKLLSAYTSFVDKPITVVFGHPPYGEARSIVVLRQLMNDLTPAQRQQFLQYSLPNFDLGSIKLTYGCPPIEPGTTMIVEASQLRSCGYLEQIAAQQRRVTVGSQTVDFELPTISAPTDSGSFYYLINDSVCSLAELPTFIHPEKLSDFDAMALSAQDFCKTWVKRESFSIESVSIEEKGASLPQQSQ